MAESSLSVAYWELAGEVGHFLGYGRGPKYDNPEWTTDQWNSILSSLKSGLRNFYFPVAVDGTPSSYNWSFLTPTATLTLTQAVETVMLPDDYGNIEGSITIASTTNQVAWPIQFTGEGIIRQKYSLLPAETGRPLMAAVRPRKGTQLERGQRFEIIVWPIPDQDYTINLRYYLLPDVLSGMLPYAYGGATHSETLLESCLAIAEERLDDARTVHAGKFRERLAASVSMDRRSKSANMGYNADRSDQPDLTRRDLYWNRGVTIYRIQYTFLLSVILWHLVQSGVM